MPDPLRVVAHLDEVPTRADVRPLLVVQLPADVELLGRLHQVMGELHPGYTAGGGAGRTYIFYAPDGEVPA